MAAKLRKLQRRIRNIHHIRQIAKAMYTIASSQVILRKRQLLSARSFPKEAEKVLAEIAAWAKANFISHPFLDGNGKPGHGLLVINADRGLCGRYVDEVNRAAVGFLRERPKTKLLVVGEKSIRVLRRGPWQVQGSWRRLERPTLDHARAIATEVLSVYREVGEVHVVYTEFRGELIQRVNLARLLPIPLAKVPARELLLEPELPLLIEELGRAWLLGRIHQILVEAKTSEHAARRQAMKAATDNADELLEKLTIQYNKARQQRITLELMDIMGGAEAVREET